MKTNNFVITLFVAAAFLMGCKPAEEKSTADQFEKVKRETKAAAEEMKEYSYAQKDEFVVKMRVQLDGINRDLDELSVKVEKSSEATKAEWKPKVQALRDQADKLNTQLEQAKSATESTWDDVKSGARKAYDELKDGFQKARQWVSEKIAP